MIKRIPLKAKRRYDCKHYWRCLCYSANHRVAIVPCSECKLFESGDTTTMEDMNGIYELIGAIFQDSDTRELDADY